MAETTQETYLTALDALASVSGVLLKLADQFDVTAMRVMVDRYDTIAPLVASTAYQNGGGMNLRDQAAFLAALDQFVTELRKLDRRQATR